MDVSPVPTDEELAAITAAYSVLMTAFVAAPEPAPTGNPWRFSGRWWSRPIASRRVRPG